MHDYEYIKHLIDVRKKQIERRARRRQQLFAFVRAVVARRVKPLLCRPAEKGDKADWHTTATNRFSMT